MNALANVLPFMFKSPVKDMNKRAVDPSSNPDGGFANNSSQKTNFPVGTATKSATTKETSSASSAATASPSASSSAPSTATPTASSSTTLQPPSSSIDTYTSAFSSSSSTISPSSSSAAGSKDDSSTGGLSGGAIGAIVAVILIICGGCLAFFIMRRRRQKRMIARAGAGAMRDPYNEGFVSFPPPPAPMAFTSDPTPLQNNSAVSTSAAAGPAQYQHQLAPITSPPMTYNYQNTNPYTLPVTAPSMVNTPPLSSSNIPATMVTSVAPPSDQPGSDIWQQTPIGTFTIVTTYVPTLSDEIDVQLNDQVQIFEEYDDGWCLGVNLTRGQAKGVFPKHCIVAATEPQANSSSMSLTISEPTVVASAGKRVSSLYMENPNLIHS